MTRSLRGEIKALAVDIVRSDHGDVPAMVADQSRPTAAAF